VVLSSRGYRIPWNESSSAILASRARLASLVTSIVRATRRSNDLFALAISSPPCWVWPRREKKSMRATGRGADLLHIFEFAAQMGIFAAEKGGQKCPNTLR
jgi:hypothetical protein